VRTDVLVAARTGRLPQIECRGALTARCTGSDTVHLVSTAANPLGGDEIIIRVVVPPGARLRIRSTAASIVLPGPDSPESVLCWDIDVGGELDVDPEPTVVAARSRHLSDVHVQLGDEARIRIREHVQIGRTGEREGFWSGRLQADLPGGPLLRHRMELGAGAVGDDVLGTPLACVSELRYPEPAIGCAGTTYALAAGGSLSTWQGPLLPARRGGGAHPAGPT